LLLLLLQSSFPCGFVQESGKEMFRGKVHPEEKQAPTLQGVYKISPGCMINIPESDFADCIPDSHFSRESEYSEDDETISDNNADIQDGDEWYGCVSTIRHGGKDDLSKTLKSNTIKQDTDADGNTFLHIAVYEDKEDKLDFLLEKYPKQINKENKKKQTPLHIAAKLNRSEIARKLIEKEAERDIQDINMFTPLLTAVMYDSLEVFDLLVDESTNGGSKNIDMQLLQIAAKHNSKRVAEKLIQTHDAAFLASKTDESETNLVHLATDNNSVDVLERKDGDKNIKKQITTPLHIAARAGYLDCLKVLIRVREVDFYRQSEHGETALHLAAANGKKGVVEELLKAAPELKDVKDASGQTALYSAIKHVKIVEILIKSGAEVDDTDNHGRTPISYAAEKGLLECTKRLIDKAKINEGDNEMVN
ncbi:ankyrin-2-like, partial [Ruditapes philippinarum]|uniref:ankyrin-2-like n=1 Tax=Ruditapes philippinarum TaxID=129788 RepID=UPI00295C30E8